FSMMLETAAFPNGDDPLIDTSTNESAITPQPRSVNFSRVPDELLAAHPRRRIDLRMQRRSGPYESPKLKPFQSTGVRLGAVVPQVVSSAAPSSSSPATQVGQCSQPEYCYKNTAFHNSSRINTWSALTRANHDPPRYIFPTNPYRVCYTVDKSTQNEGIFPPYDPVAYRLKPLFIPEYRHIRPVKLFSSDDLRGVR
ncbi:hypothetical protein ANCDUO_18584, partial [Ancylostoma duodenale]